MSRSHSTLYYKSQSRLRRANHVTNRTYLAKWSSQNMTQWQDTDSSAAGKDSITMTSSKHHGSCVVFLALLLSIFFFLVTTLLDNTHTVVMTTCQHSHTHHLHPQRHTIKCGAGRICRADLNGDNLRIFTAYLRISDHCKVRVRLELGLGLGQG